VDDEGSAPYTPAVLTDDDLRYIRSEFAPLDELCDAGDRDFDRVRARIKEGELPAPAYVLADGTQMVPRDYFELPLGDEFVRRYRGTELEEDVEAFMDGTYFVCLRRATPENIVRKGELVEELRRLLADPRPEEPVWQTSVRQAVDELDGLERQFSPHYDRQRFDRPPTRDELIEAARKRFPQLWADRAA
jgi:Family of unknown function (DUF6058)